MLQLLQQGLEQIAAAIIPGIIIPLLFPLVVDHWGL